MLYDIEQSDMEQEENYEEEDEYKIVPSPDQLSFGNIELTPEYREALYEAHPYYTVEQIIQTYLGYNVEFPSMDDFMLEHEQIMEDEKEESESTDGESTDED